MIKKGYKSPRYSQKEDEIIMQAVKNCPHNLEEAFRRASKVLVNRSANSIQNRYYGSLKNIHEGFAIKSNGSEHMNNVKNKFYVKDNDKMQIILSILTPEQKTELLHKLLS